MAQILVVDDNDDIREMLRQLLERAGHDVSDTHNADEALQSYRDKPADLLIVDLLMPEKQGMTSIPEFLREFPDVKIRRPLTRALTEPWSPAVTQLSSSSPALTNTPATLSGCSDSGSMASRSSLLLTKRVPSVPPLEWFCLLSSSAALPALSSRWIFKSPTSLSAK